MNKFCSNCGNKLIEGSSFCDNCGEKVINNLNNEKNININNKSESDNYNSLKKTSLIIGIVSIILSFILNFMIIPAAIVGLIFGILYCIKAKKFCIGIILNFLGIIIPILIIIFIVYIFSLIETRVDIDDYYDNYYDYNYDYDYDYDDDDYDYDYDYDYDDDDYDYDYDYDDYYDDNDSYNSSSNEGIEYFKMVDVNKIKSMINNKEDFIIVVTQTGCSHCIKFKPKVESVANKHKINIYYIEYDLLTENEKNIFGDYVNFSGTPTTEFFVKGVENTEIRIVGNIVTEQEFEQILIDNNYIK